MKAKKLRKRQQETPNENHPSKTQQPPLRIKFNINQDSIACFIGDKKSAKKRNTKAHSLKKTKGAFPPALSQTRQQPENPTASQPSMGIKQTESEEIVQGSLNSILSEIENKGIMLAWSEREQISVADQKQQNQASELWSVFSVTDSKQKSPASTVDVRQNVVYYHPESYNYPAYTYSYCLKPYEEGSIYLVREDDILHDPRTTIMIRNIPNKYTIKELSEEIDQRFGNTYDFLYLPCDIKNQCNVGYGFINFLSTQFLADFYQFFQGRRWSKFRSEKICNLTYARLQGLDSLIDHFENSKVLNQKDKKYRPIIREFGKIESLIKTQQSL